MTYLLSVDPGLMTGLVLGEYTDDTTYERLAYWQVSGGLGGFLEWHYQNWDRGEHWLFGIPYEERISADFEIKVIAEKFVPLSGGGFSHTLKSVEPLRIEGAMVALGMIEDYAPDGGNANWQRADKQYFCGGKTKAEKRKLSKQFLKDHGLYLTGKDVGQKDAEDYFSSILHAFAYMRKIGHEPTLKHYFGSERKGQ